MSDTSGESDLDMPRKKRAPQSSLKRKHVPAHVIAIESDTDSGIDLDLPVKKKRARKDDVLIETHGFYHFAADLWDTESESDLDLPPKRKRARINDIDSTTPKSTSQFANFEKNGRIFMAEAVSSTSIQGFEWQKELATQSSDDWFDELAPFIPDHVKAAFNRSDRPPTPEELSKLPWHGDNMGVYLDVLEPKLSTSGLKTHLYPGCAAREYMTARRSHHSTTFALDKAPTMLYYQLKHGTNDYTSNFVTLARIPIPGTLDGVLISRRRKLCRLAETLFTIWIRGFQVAHKLTKHIVIVTERAFQRAYGIAAFEGLDFVGFATHSPLKEQLGDRDYGTKASGRYDDVLEGLTEVYGGKENIPAEAEQRARKRATNDAASQREWARQRCQRLDEEGDDWRARKSAADKARRDNRTGEELEEERQCRADYSVNRKLAMTESEKEDELEEIVCGARRRSFIKAFEEGNISQQHVDAAKANDWYVPPGFPKLWRQTKERETEARRKRSLRVKAAFKRGVLSQQHIDAAEANDWYTPKCFPKGWRDTDAAPLKPVRQPLTSLPSLASNNAAPKTKQSNISSFFSK